MVNLPKFILQYVKICKEFMPKNCQLYFPIARTSKFSEKLSKELLVIPDKCENPVKLGPRNRNSIYEILFIFKKVIFFMISSAFQGI